MSENDKYKILIVDDERSYILALNHILKPEYSILAAIDGETALEIAKENLPDLILLDVIMPDMTGFEVLTKLKSDEKTRKIPVIFISGKNDCDDEEKGFTLGAADYIVKPFKDPIVMARVKTQLQIVSYIRELEKTGLTDPLTKLPNRRNFESRMHTEWYRSMREKEPISILMIDVDKFGNYNDTYGHLQGDKLLQAFGTEVFLKITKRHLDFAARWGGGEFALLLPNTDSNGALAVAETLRSAAENAVIPTNDGSPTRFTISIGAATMIPSADIGISDIISTADKALNKAKNSGMNRVCHP
jgi:diguanylate cyclase (GGDEF)-like protein